jgi:4-hydroxybenzoate polyprenyltransferase
MQLVRAAEWWEYKLVPIVAAFYATAIFLRVTLFALWPAALMLLLSMMPGAAFVSVINDYSDREEDRIAGKPNRMSNVPPGLVAALIAITAGAGLLFSWLWHDDPLLLDCYVAAWVAFSIYSLPPFRFKSRGFAGVLCDACGSALFPTLVAVLLVFRAAARPLDMVWLAIIAAWALAFGLRGILWHQLMDVENDRTAGVRTFATRHPSRFVARAGALIVFPIELIAFAIVLERLRAPWTLAALVFYAFVSALRMHIWGLAPVIVAARANYFLVLHEYYIVFFPLALLLTAALRNAIDFAALAAHIVLFPGQLSRTLRDLWNLRPGVLRFASGPR